MSLLEKTGLVALFIALGALLGMLYHFKRAYVAAQKEAVDRLDLVQAQAADLKDKTEALFQSKAACAKLEAENQLIKKQLAHLESQDLLPKKHLLVHFEHAVQRLLATEKKALSNKNLEQLSYLLNPLKEQIRAFEKKLHEQQQTSSDRNIALRTQLQEMVKTHQKIGDEARRFTEAIHGSSGFQAQALGKWGEFVLTRILRESGLREGQEYILQSQFKTTDGRSYRPDVVVKLPDNKSIIIDAKVSLTAYEQFYHAKDKTEQEKNLKNHLKSIKQHIRRLTEKQYAPKEALGGLDFVLMFLPIEPAFMVAIQKDPGLFEEAYRKNIILAGPTTLMATLRTVAHTWRVQHQNIHALQIMRQSGLLYDKFAGFVETHLKIGHALANAQKAYDQSTKKLHTGQGNLLHRAEKLKSLGAHTQKSLPDHIPS